MLRPYTRIDQAESPSEGTSYGPDYVGTVGRYTAPGVVPGAPAGQVGPWPGPPQSARRPPPVEAPPNEGVLQMLEPPGHIASARPPQGNRGIWIRYEGSRWEAQGEAVELERSRFVRIGSYHGFPVYSEAGAGAQPSVIFVPSRDDLLVPYKKTAE